MKKKDPVFAPHKCKGTTRVIFLVLDLCFKTVPLKGFAVYEQ